MRVLLASAQFDLRLALEILLREEPGTDIVGTASEAATASSLLQASLPDLLILDWDLPGYAPTLLLAEARRLRHCPQIIVLGRDEAARQEALPAGADAFVMAGDLPADLMAAIRQSCARHRAGTKAAVLSGDTPQAAAGGQILAGTEESQLRNQIDGGKDR